MTATARTCASPACTEPTTDSGRADDNPDYCDDCNGAFWTFWIDGDLPAPDHPAYDDLAADAHTYA